MAMVFTPMTSSRNLALATDSHLSRKSDAMDWLPTPLPPLLPAASTGCPSPCWPCCCCCSNTRGTKEAGWVRNTRPRTSKKPSITFTILTLTFCASSPGWATKCTMARKVGASRAGTSCGDSCSMTSDSADAAMASAATSGGNALGAAVLPTPPGPAANPAGGMEAAPCTLAMAACSTPETAFRRALWMRSTSGMTLVPAPSNRYDSTMGSTAVLSLPRFKMAARLGSSRINSCGTSGTALREQLHSLKASSTKHSDSGVLRLVEYWSKGYTTPATCEFLSAIPFSLPTK
mmetsp:Transcript_12504/g.34141  ORF Transcript_12504/g.34141 Transcript_12504/m.34141 type:complete len:290 (-) Transcript_12504:2397-3266(-)